MMKIKLGLIFSGLATALAGCASSPTPTYYNGQYYWAGDPGCVRLGYVSATRAMCYNKKGVEQGWEDAIPQYELNAYSQRQAVGRQNIQALTNQINQIGNDIARSNAEAANSYSRTLGSMPTSVAPIGPQQTQTTCLVNGQYVSCRTRPQ